MDDTTPTWYPNPLPRIMRILLVTGFPTVSIILFVSTAFVLPALFRSEVKWWIVAFATALPIVMNAWAVFLAAREPKRVALQPDALVWETGLRKTIRIPKERVLRLEPLQNRKHGIAMCFYVDEKGRERWTGFTVEIERAIQAWLNGSVS